MNPLPVKELDQTFADWAALSGLELSEQTKSTDPLNFNSLHSIQPLSSRTLAEAPMHWLICWLHVSLVQAHNEMVFDWLQLFDSNQNVTRLNHQHKTPSFVTAEGGLIFWSAHTNAPKPYMQGFGHSVASLQHNRSRLVSVSMQHIVVRRCHVLSLHFSRCLALILHMHQIQLFEYQSTMQPCWNVLISQNFLSFLNRDCSTNMSQTQFSSAITSVVVMPVARFQQK